MTTKLAKQHRAQLRPLTGFHWKECGNEPYYRLPATPEAYEAQVEELSMICAAGMLASYVKGQLGAQVVTDAREDYQLAREALAAIGITKPTGAKGDA